MNDYMAPGDNYVTTLTRFGGGRQIVVTTELGETVHIQINEKGEFMGRIVVCAPQRKKLVLDNSPKLFRTEDYKTKGN